MKGSAATYISASPDPDPLLWSLPLKLLFFILFMLLIAQIGFWGTLGAIIGAALMLVAASVR